MSLGVGLEWVMVLGAAGLDFAIGDPWDWLHPVQVMGIAIKHLSQVALKYCKTPTTQCFAGIVIALFLILGSAAIVHFSLQLAYQLHPLVGIAIELIVLASCFAGRSLRDAAEDVLLPLRKGKLQEAQSRLSRYVGRDTAYLKAPEIQRAILETVAENGVDGVMAPLFWAIVGVFAPGSPAVWAIAFKASSTLDSMIGYKRMPYRYLGTASAKIDDLLTFLPCRLTVLTLGVMTRKPIVHWRTCQKEGRLDPSPNSGWSECAYAIALGVQLGGLNYYQGVAKFKPLLGIPHSSITPERIRSALLLNRRMILSWLCFTGAIVGLSIP